MSPRIAFLIILSTVLLHAEPSSARGTADGEVVRPAVLSRFMPDSIGSLPRKKNPSKVMRRSRNGLLQSECQTFYGQGQVVLTIEHLTDKRSLKSMAYNNYVHSGDIVNSSLSRTVNQLDYGHIVRTMYIKAHYKEALVLLNNGICVRFICTDTDIEMNNDQLMQLIQVDKLLALTNISSLAE